MNGTGKKEKNIEMRPWLRSRFRGRFVLGSRERAIVSRTDRRRLRLHALSILKNRVGLLQINDGMQTPWRGHPVFVAQHACALCCRQCVQKWHNVPLRQALNQETLERFAGLLLEWISLEMEKEPAVPKRHLLTLDSMGFFLKSPT